MLKFFLVGKACAGTFFSQMEDIDIRKHLFNFFPMAPLVQFVFSFIHTVIFCCAEFF